MISGRKRKAITFTVLGVCLVAAAVTLNVSWLVLNWREGMIIVFGSIAFLVIIAVGVINTIFLVREIRRNEQHDSFINAVTHELKTPVASIRLYLQTLQSRELEDEKRREFYRIMLEDSDRLLHMIDQVLRAGATGSILRRGARVRLDLGQIARECVELARTRFHLDPDALRYVEHTSNAIVLGDGEELRAAVWNLLDNAVKYSPERRTIRVSVERLPTGVVITVRDGGLGIARAEQRDIFRKFVRGQQAARLGIKGTGLGLAMADHIVRAHGGAIELESEEGVGSTFRVVLPAVS
jgi:two-component system, OmpR family, sensor histidine kinase SenX3